MNIGIMNLGRAFKFGAEKGKRCHGDLERRGLVYALSRMEKARNIVLLSRSDWAKLSDSEAAWLDPNNKVCDVYMEVAEEEWKANHTKLTQSEQLKHIKWMHNFMSTLPRLDVVLGFKSTSAPFLLPDYMPGVRKEGMVKLLGMIFQHISPQVWYLNKSNVPWYTILTDPRLMRGGHRESIVNTPRRVLAQYKDDMLLKPLETDKRGCTKHKEVFVPMDYAAAETLAMAGDTTCFDPSTERKHRMTIVAMQSTIGSGPKDYRLQQLEEWILPHAWAANVHVYGEWQDWRVDKWPQFKGYISQDDLTDRMRQSRYTFIIPVNRDWATTKYLESLREGVLPFLHPDYDTQGNVFPLDHPCRVSDWIDLKNAIKFYEQYPNDRIKLVKELQHCLVKPEHHADSFILHLSKVLKSDLGLEL